VTGDASMAMDSTATTLGSSPLPGARQEKLLRRSARAGLWLAALASAAFLCLVILHSPLAVLLALAAGIAVRCAGQRWNLTQVRRSARAADLANFEWEGGWVHCSFHEEPLLRYIQSWKLRISATIAASSVCFAAQRWPVFGLDSATGHFHHLHWLSAAVNLAASCLPVLAGIVFWWAGVPERRWSGQVKAAIETRAKDAIGKLMAPGEIDGLQAGIEVLWQRLGVSRVGEYRAAIARRLQAHPTEAVLESETAVAMVNATTELARQDLVSLGNAAETYQQVKSRLKGFESLVLKFRDPLRETRAEELQAELEQLPRLAINRRWDDLQRHAAWIKSELEDAEAKLLHHAATIPALMLPPGSDPYRLLGVSVDTPTPLIKKLRLRLAQLYHPDVSESIGNSTKMAELNAAYDAVMKDREKEGR